MDKLEIKNGLEVIHQAQELVESFEYDEENILETDVFKEFEPYFKTIFNELFTDEMKLKSFGLNVQDISEDSLKGLTPKETLEKMGFHLPDDVDITDLDSMKEAVKNAIQKKYLESPDIQTKNKTLLFFDDKLLNEINNTLKDYIQVHEENKTNENIILKKYIISRQYGDSYEYYFKFMKGLYCSYNLIDSSDYINSGKILKFVKDKDNLKKLMDLDYNDIRNNIFHSNYNEDQIYTDEEILEFSRTLILRSVTGIIIKIRFLVEMYGYCSSVFLN